jgi:hypothetical protein
MKIHLQIPIMLSKCMKIATTVKVRVPLLALYKFLEKNKLLAYHYRFGARIHVTEVTGHWMDDGLSISAKGADIFLSSKASRLAVLPTQPHTKWVRLLRNFLLGKRGVET